MHDLLANAHKARVVFLVRRHTDVVLVAACQNVERGVTTLLEFTGSQQRPHARVFHLRLKLLAFIIDIKVLIYDVEGSTTVILFACGVLNFCS